MKIVSFTVSIIQIMLVGAKLFGYTSLAWWKVLLPIIGILGVSAAIFLCMVMAAIVIHLMEKSR